MGLVGKEQAYTYIPDHFDSRTISILFISHISTEMAMAEGLRSTCHRGS
jgi:hypothetical protein